MKKISSETYEQWLLEFQAGKFGNKRLGEAFQDIVLRNYGIVDIDLYYQASPKRADQQIKQKYLE